MTPTNIWCVGRNYADHARELNNPVPTKPMIFLKAGSSIGGSELSFPQALGSIHFECELALQFDDRLQLSRMGLAIDFTAREAQDQLKAQGHPWTLAKSFKNACALGSLVPIHDLAKLQEAGGLELFINGELRQQGVFKDMIFPMKQLAEYVCAFFPVKPGDLLLTGTPKGVGAVAPGDQLEAKSLDGTIPAAHWRIGGAL